MDHLTSSEWWWTVAFDGVATTTIATAIAVWFVLRTLRSDRKHAEEALKQARDLAWEDTFRTDCRALGERSRDLNERRARGLTTGPDNATFHSDCDRWSAEVLDLAQRAREQDPNFAEIMLTVWGQVTNSSNYGASHIPLSSMSTDQTASLNKFLAGMQTAINMLGTRATTPEVFTELTDSDVARHVASIRQGVALKLG